MKTDELVRQMEDRAERGTPRDPVVVVGVASWNAAGRRRRSIVGGVAAAALLIVCGVAIGQAIAERDAPVRVVTPVEDDGVAPSDIPTLPMVEHNGIGLRVPDGWNTTDENLTTGVSPQVVAAFGTGPLVAGGGDSCRQVPIQAILAMDDGDVFAAVIERLGGGGDWSSRESSLWGMRGDANSSEAVTCPEWPNGFDAWWFQFADGGRTFHVLAVMGPSVSDQRRALFEAAIDEIFVERLAGMRPSVSVPSDLPPPHPLPHGAIGHPIDVDGRELLVGTRLRREGWCAELFDPTELASIVQGCVAEQAPMTLASGGDVLGVAPQGAATVRYRGDDGEWHKAEVFELEGDPGVPLWVADLDDSMDAGDLRIRYRDADGNEVVADPSR